MSGKNELSEVRNVNGKVWSIEEIESDLKEILAYEDEDGLNDLVQRTKTWKECDKELLVRMIELCCRPIKRGRKSLSQEQTLLQSAACLVSAHLRGESFNGRWGQLKSTKAPKKPDLSLAGAKELLRASGSKNDYYRRTACKTFGISAIDLG